MLYAFLKFGVVAVMLGFTGFAPARKLNTAGKAGAPGVLGRNVLWKDRVDPSLLKVLYQRLVGGASKKMPELARTTVLELRVQAKPRRGDQFLPGVRKLCV